MADRKVRALARLSDVAREAGVSTATVSNVVNRPGVVAEPTRRRVEAAIRKLDFVPNEGAAGLRRGHNRLVGLVIPDVLNPFYAQITATVLDAAERANYAVILCNSADDVRREEGHLARLAELRAAGTLVAPLTTEVERLDRIRDRGVNIVLIDRPAPGGGCSVSVDDVSGGRMAVEHLLRGAGEVLLVNGPHSIRQCRDRRLGAERAVRSAGLPPAALQEVVVDEMTVARGRSLAQEILAAGALPEAVFCINDLLATGFVQALLDAGIDIPGRVTIAGYGDLEHIEGASIPLTTVRQPTEDLARTAMEQLVEELEGPSDHWHQSVVYVPTLVVRSSAP